MAYRLWVRLTHALALIVFISVAGFALLRLMPGDFVEILLLSQMDGTLPDASQVARFAEANGLNDPLPVQYFRWLGALFQGDMGISLVTRAPVIDDIVLRIGKSMTLAVAGMGLALLIAIPAGILCALYPGGRIDRVCTTMTVIGMSIPNFWYALLLALLFSLVLGWLPSSGHGTLAHAVLPTLVIATSIAGVLARYIRSSLLEELTEPYIRTARAKGLGKIRTLLHHGVPNVVPGVLTLTGLQFARVFDGMIIVETLFAWPGIGRFLVESLLNRDYPAIQGCFLVIATAYILVNLAVDVAISIYDPRAREIV
ncbi:ABC transporter permease [Thalassospira sp.]|uniref:ABC transporter permease n=1 Tax=Thalassospira sp. TaxID=1912094 RepID=UPI0027344F56|nr:ABC transporter permease [Thalassospira sp.]MDP2699366.1 ABC transporter permease [Thalassospira sp.]